MKTTINALVKQSLLVLFTMAVFSSCSKKDVNIEATAPSTIMEYYNFLRQDNVGSFSMQQFQTAATQYYSSPITKVGGFFTKAGKAIPKGDVQIGNLLFSPNAAYNYEYGNRGIQGEELYGTDVVFKLNIKNTNGGVATMGANDEPTVTDTMYVPKSILLSSPIWSNDNTIQAGTKIAWNVDPKNKRGVVIILDYDPAKLPYNQGETPPAGKRVAKAIPVTDTDGSYTITAADLDGFEKGTNIDFTIGRANFKTTDAGGGEKYALYAYTIVVNDFKVIK
jgi:hypothetical protein